jgi:transcriptional regulator with XRE-family HTH domain
VDERFLAKPKENKKAKNLSQKELTEAFVTSYTTIGKYERDEMTPSIDVAKNISNHLNTTVGYLLGEVNQTDTFKDPVMLKRLQQINGLPEED